MGSNVCARNLRGSKNKHNRFFIQASFEFLVVINSTKKINGYTDLPTLQSRGYIPELRPIKFLKTLISLQLIIIPLIRLQNLVNPSML